MASLPPDTASDSEIAFALQELNACWSQAYEALCRGDLQAVHQLLEQADLHVRAAGPGRSDTNAEASLRKLAHAAYAVLQHGMQSGLDGIREELSQSRRGKKVLRGYDRKPAAVGNRVQREV
ncbi:MAG: hypothetical protein AB8H80_09100 [Planctomycetota bacterium]